MKTKNYNVRIVGVATVLVIKAKNESDAMNMAMYELSMGDMQHIESSIEEVLKTPADVERARRYADAISEPDET